MMIQFGLGRGTSRLVISKARFRRLEDQPKLAIIILSVIGTAIWYFFFFFLKGDEE